MAPVGRVPHLGRGGKGFAGEAAGLLPEIDKVRAEDPDALVQALAKSTIAMIRESAELS